MGSANAELWEIENQRLLDLLRGALEPGDGFLDVGANVGIFAIPIALHVGPGGRVFAFEPAPDMAADLRTRAESADVAGRLDIREVALGAERDTLELRVDPDDPADATKRSLFVGGDVVARVPVVPLDELVATGELTLDPPVGAVKIDVEGAEILVLRGMRSTLEAQRPRLVVVETIETHLQRAGFELDDIGRELEPLGYRRIAQEADTGLWFNAVFELD